jgi:phenylpyruvate tautomerase PptA (4-oxalocrotonate tautomerase family)
MPMWHVHYPKGVYDAADRKALANRVTELYHERIRLPKFYVSVAFHEFDPEHFFVGGEPAERFVRIWIDQIARQNTDPDRQRRWMRTLNDWLSAFLADRGLNWEIHVDNTPTEFWTIDGYLPPAAGSEDERRWLAENKTSELLGR